MVNKELEAFKKKVRKAVAVYMSSEGCGCCQDRAHPEHKEALAKLLDVPKYSDGSGYNFYAVAEEKERDE